MVETSSYIASFIKTYNIWKKQLKAEFNKIKCIANILNKNSSVNDYY